MMCSQENSFMQEILNCVIRAYKYELLLLHSIRISPRSLSWRIFDVQASMQGNAEKTEEAFAPTWC